MLSYFSKLFLRTLRDDPSDAEVLSHRLLVRAGYIRRQAPGIFAWLPLGLRVKSKVEAIIREEMAAAGAQEIHFPALLPKEPYEVTGRWVEYGDGIFRLKDRKGADYLLAPTHEEAFTLLVKDLFNSYKDLPVTLYQIQDKYRDEARPRAGLLRGREFTMKDAYSFDLSDEGLSQSYQQQRDAYERIFKRLGLEYVVVAADAGAMGGSKSEEFLHPTEIGEDSFVVSEAGYAANVEAYSVAPADSKEFDPSVVVTEFHTPESKTIESLVDSLNAKQIFGRSDWQAAETLKHVVLALTDLEGKRSLVIVAIPGDREVDLKRAEVAFAPAEVEAATAEDFAKHPELVAGFIGPVANGTQLLGEKTVGKIPYLVDPRVASGTVWVSGANRADYHLAGLSYGRDFSADGVADIANVRDGDPAPDGSGPIRIARGMEIGHVFQLGRKYAEALGLKVLDQSGRQATVTMGSYGIGVTRVLAILAENTADDKGLVWPKQIAPYQLHLIATGKDSEVFEVGQRLAEQLSEAGVEVLYDDREKVSPGVKFSDAELLGIPTILVVGRNLAENKVELWDRASGNKQQIELEAGLLPTNFLALL